MSERRCCTLFQLTFDLVEFGVEDFACRLLRELPKTCPIELQLLQRIISPRYATGDELVEPFLEEDALSECAIVLKFRRSTFHYFVSIRQHFGETILQRHQPRDVGGLGGIFLRVLPCQTPPFVPFEVSLAAPATGEFLDTSARSIPYRNG